MVFILNIITQFIYKTVNYKLLGIWAKLIMQVITKKKKMISRRLQEILCMNKNSVWGNFVRKT